MDDGDNGKSHDAIIGDIPGQRSPFEEEGASNDEQQRHQRVDNRSMKPLGQIQMLANGSISVAR